MIRTGEILRRFDGNYCFSCNHCGKYYDAIPEIIDHMNEVKNSSQESKSVLTDTEFVDVSTTLDVKHEVVEDDFDDIRSRNGMDDFGDSNDFNVTNSTPQTQEICTINTVRNKHYIKFSPSDDELPEMDRLPKSIYYQKEQTQSEKSVTNQNGDYQLIKCCWCSESFNNEGLMLYHLTDDHNKKPSDVHTCVSCKLFFKNPKLLCDHISMCHDQNEIEKFRKASEFENTKPIQCAVCHLWTFGTKSFDAHTKRAHKMYRILQCYICGIFKKKPSGLIDHLKVHDRFRKYRCYECDNIEPKITNPNDERLHKCVLCSVWFPSHQSIRTHLENYHGQDQIYDCSMCDDYTFKTEWDLKMHGINVHKIPMDYKCKFCNKLCKSIPSLKEHQKTHLIKFNTNVCTICGSKFRRKDYLARHIKSSHGEITKDYTCYICKKQFQSNGYLKNHIKRHTEKKLHQCDICGNRFLLAGLLRKHMKEHEGEIWKCEQCHKEFSNKSKLTAHAKTHVTERNFQCDVCCKTYKTSKNLRQHKLVHSLERRIKCRICNMTFNQGPEHMLHLQTHDNI